ncbi:kelch protein 8 [Biomphalaria glabrata]|nr:kelch protein 8 [Biomphalaria glabrata]
MPNKTSNVTRPKATQKKQTARQDTDSPLKTRDVVPFTENRLYVINKSGTGDVCYLLVKEKFSAILSYHVHTERWAKTVNLSDFGVVALGKFVYVIGGFHKLRNTCVNKVRRFDPAEVTWSHCANLLTARCKFGVCTFRGKIFVCGGEKDGKITSGCEMYDPEADIWTKCEKLIQPRSSPACTALGDVIVCAGGYFNGQIHDNFWIYDRNRWQELGSHSPIKLPYCLQKCAVTLAGDTPGLFFVGGASSKVQKGMDNSGEETPVNMAYTERRIFSSNADVTVKGQQFNSFSMWNTAFPPMFCARHNAGAVAIGQNIHVIGGTTVETGDHVTVAERFDLNRGEWTKDFTLKNCDVSNVSCLLMEVSKTPMSERKMMQQRLKWIMW